jgi:hypothetical protein
VHYVMVTCKNSFMTSHFGCVYRIVRRAGFSDNIFISYIFSRGPLLLVTVNIV